jgi:hypothetical protein
VSVTASDDVDVTSTSTNSITEQDQNIDDKPTMGPSQKSVVTSSSNTTASSRGPVQLLRRQPNPSTTSSSASPTTMSPQMSRQATPATPADGARQPSPTRIVIGGEGSATTATGAQTPVRGDAIDPSLLEAFANPMNRQYLLQLEGSLNNFVTQSRFFPLKRWAGMLTL